MGTLLVEIGAICVAFAQVGHFQILHIVAVALCNVRWLLY